MELYLDSKGPFDPENQRALKHLCTMVIPDGLRQLCGSKYSAGFNLVRMEVSLFIMRRYGQYSGHFLGRSQEINFQVHAVGQFIAEISESTQEIFLLAATDLKHIRISTNESALQWARGLMSIFTKFVDLISFCQLNNKLSASLSEEVLAIVESSMASSESLNASLLLQPQHWLDLRCQHAYFSTRFSEDDVYIFNCLRKALKEAKKFRSSQHQLRCYQMLLNYSQELELAEKLRSLCLAECVPVEQRIAAMESLGDWFWKQRMFDEACKSYHVSWSLWDKGRKDFKMINPTLETVYHSLHDWTRLSVGIKLMRLENLRPNLTAHKDVTESLMHYLQNAMVVPASLKAAALGLLNPMDLTDVLFICMRAFPYDLQSISGLLVRQMEMTKDKASKAAIVFALSFVYRAIRYLNNEATQISLEAQRSMKPMKITSQILSAVSYKSKQRQRVNKPLGVGRKDLTEVIRNAIALSNDIVSAEEVISVYLRLIHQSSEKRRFPLDSELFDMEEHLRNIHSFLTTSSNAYRTNCVLWFGEKPVNMWLPRKPIFSIVWSISQNTYHGTLLKNSGENVDQTMLINVNAASEALLQVLQIVRALLQRLYSETVEELPQDELRELWQKIVLEIGASLQFEKAVEVRMMQVEMIDRLL